MTKLVAFWGYDTYPYTLWGEVSETTPKGTVYVPSYQSYFRPFLVLEESEANPICAKLTELKEERLKALDELSKSFIAKAKKELPAIPVESCEGYVRYLRAKDFKYGVKCVAPTPYLSLYGYVFYGGDIYALKEKQKHLALIAELQGDEPLISYTEVKVNCWTLAITCLNTSCLEFLQGSNSPEHNLVSKEVLEQLYSVINTLGLNSHKTTLNGIPLANAYEQLKLYGRFMPVEAVELITPRDEDDW